MLKVYGITWFPLCQTYSWAVPPTTWHAANCTRLAPDVLQVICTRLRPGNVSVRVGDCSRRSEATVNNLKLRLTVSLFFFSRVCPRFPSKLCQCWSQITLAEHGLFRSSAVGTLAATFLHSFLAISPAVILSVLANYIPQAPQHFCPSKLWARCDACSACQSICLLTPSGSAASSAEVEPFHAQSWE